MEAGSFCGNAGHFLQSLNHGAFVIMPDLKYCNYLMIFGTNFGFGGFQQFVNQLMAKARARGMKLVVFDPLCNNAATHADEWVPLVPATDLAVIIAMQNVIVNELDICDAEYLKHKTNAPYFISDDGRYVREKGSNKPMVWDAAASKATTFDDPAIGDFALDGNYEVNGISCRPCWQMLKESFKDVTPEKASQVSTVPAATIRRIAKEFAEAAKIGATITIDGKQLPYRPVACQYIRSAGTHQKGLHTLWAIDLLQHVVGAVSVPGGAASVAVECHGYEKTGRLNLAVIPNPDDGFVRTAGQWLLPEGWAWPLRGPHKPVPPDLAAVFPCAMDSPGLSLVDRDEVWRKLGIPTEYDVVINYASNAIMNSTNPKDRESFYNKDTLYHRYRYLSKCVQRGLCRHRPARNISSRDDGLDGGPAFLSQPAARTRPPLVLPHHPAGRRTPVQKTPCAGDGQRPPHTAGSGSQGQYVLQHNAQA
jgi:anaerobic selenocysteine-containing dehydrogenase